MGTQLAGTPGVTKEELERIWADVQANAARLDACAGPHQFVVADEDARFTRRRYRCTVCSGEVDAVARSWYEAGLKHGRVGDATP